ncbi:hypothetical protein Lal_00014013 [Lupinus albus]|nr:hypothetical protein Lal_00014013 [Lupinus albus]
MQIFQQKNDELSQAAITLLMIPIKSKESEELFSIADKNRVQSALGQLQNLCRASGLLSESRNSHLQQPSNPQATADNHQARVMASASFQGLTGGQRGNVGAPLQSVSRPNDLFDLQSEQK